MQFRKRPIVIEALQWKGGSNIEIAAFLGDNSWKYCYETNTTPEMLEISTLEGTICASRNDWIIRGIQGEFYPCKPDIFEKTYEPVSSTQS